MIARAKSEVLVTIVIVYSKKNIRQKRKRLTKSVGLISKKTTLQVQQTFLYISFAVVLHGYYVKLPTLYTFY